MRRAHVDVHLLGMKLGDGEVVDAEALVFGIDARLFMVDFLNFEWKRMSYACIYWWIT